MSIELYVALLGVLRLGGVAVFVDAWADRGRLDAAVAAARPVAFLGTPRAHLLRAVSGALRSIRVRRIVRRGLGGEGAPASAAPAAIDGSADALVTFTTGTTGRPKAAARSHAFLWAQHVALARELGHRPEDVDCTTLPVFVLHALATGCTSVLPEFDPRRPARVDAGVLLRQLREERVTTCTASPAFVAALLERLGPDGRLPLRALFTGGAPVMPALAARMAALAGVDARVVYGSTEAEPIASVAAGELAAAAIEPSRGLLAGAPSADLALRIVRAVDGPVALDARGLPAWDVADGEPGEVVVAGEHVLARYLDDPEAQRAQKVHEGARTWHRTGDAARLDASGRLWLLGRVGQRLERDGRVTWPLPVELAALRVSGIRHAAWIVRARAGGRALAVLCVETANGGLTADLERALRDSIAPAQPDELRVLRRIPRDPRHATKTDVGALLAVLDRDRRGR
jgi:acyl-CoA synthetase (AMP-forming)/AMP-acid ligase II